MSDAVLAHAETTRAGWRVSSRKLVNFLFFIFIVSGAIAIVEPSPYDFASLIAMPVWFVCGFRVHRMFVPYFLLMTVYLLSGFIALIPYWNEPDPVVFELQSLYLYITAIFFGLFFGERTLERGELCLKAFALACVISSIAGIIGYFDIAGTGLVFATYGRAAGTFKDPNVFGSFLILGALYCMQLIMLRRAKHVFIVVLSLAIIIAGVFFSFSRGSWGAFMFASMMMIGMALVTNPDPKVRRQILIGVLVAIVLAAILLAVLMSVDSIRELAFQRSQSVGEEYDDRRFDNQARSLSMLLDRPLGFGPLRFRNYFDLEPHSSYVNAFASYGWLGGFSFLLLVGVTGFIGFRQCFARSPFRSLSQVVWPSLMVFFLQGFQIDIDHWRHVYLMIGMVWGVEAARRRWMEDQDRELSAIPSQRRAAASARA